MAKPPPTRTTSKAPVSLPSIKALSSAPAETKAGPAAPAAPKPAPVAVSAAQKPVPPVAAAPSPVQPAAVPASAAPPAAAPNPPQPPAPAKVEAPAKAPAKPPRKIAAARLRVEKPVIVAQKKPMEATPALKPALAEPAAPVQVKPVASKPAAIEPVEVKPVEPPKPAAKIETPPKPEPVVAAPPEPAPVIKVAEPAPVVARAVPKPVSLKSLPLPRPPEFAAVTTETVMSQALTMARAFGALQAEMLDHACAELKATLGEAETLARTKSASEAIAFQAKAVRRSYESYAEHLKELARIANAALRKG